MAKHSNNKWQNNKHSDPFSAHYKENNYSELAKRFPTFKVYNAKTCFNLNLEALSKEANNIVNTLHKAGHDVYYVGGVIRDLLIGLKFNDIDICSTAQPEEVKQVFNRRCKVIGRRFVLCHVSAGSEKYDVASLREDRHSQNITNQNDLKVMNQGILLVDNNYSRDIAEDALRRDFTINALYGSVVHNHIIDFFNGVQDLLHHRIVMIGDPNIRLREDPMRIIRAIRQSAKLNFDIDPELRQAIFRHKSLLKLTSQYRLSDELNKTLSCGAALKTIEQFIEYDLSDICLPQFTSIIEQEIINNEDFLYVPPLKPEFEAKINALAQKWSVALESQGVNPNLIQQHSRSLALTLAGAIITDARVADNQPVNPAFMLTTMRAVGFIEAYMLLLNSRSATLDDKFRDQVIHLAENTFSYDSSALNGRDKENAHTILINLAYLITLKAEDVHRTRMQQPMFRAAFSVFKIYTQLFQVDETTLEHFASWDKLHTRYLRERAQREQHQSQYNQYNSGYTPRITHNIDITDQQLQDLVAPVLVNIEHALLMHNQLAHQGRDITALSLFEQLRQEHYQSYTPISLTPKKDLTREVVSHAHSTRAVHDFYSVLQQLQTTLKLEQVVSTPKTTLSVPLTQDHAHIVPAKSLEHSIANVNAFGNYTISPFAHRMIPNILALELSKDFSYYLTPSSQYNNYSSLDTNNLSHQYISRELQPQSLQDFELTFEELVRANILRLYQDQPLFQHIAPTSSEFIPAVAQHLKLLNQRLIARQQALVEFFSNKGWKFKVQPFSLPSLISQNSSHQAISSTTDTNNLHTTTIAATRILGLTSEQRIAQLSEYFGKQAFTAYYEALPRIWQEELLSNPFKVPVPLDLNNTRDTTFIENYHILFEYLLDYLDSDQTPVATPIPDINNFAQVFGDLLLQAQARASNNPTQALAALNLSAERQAYAQAEATRLLRVRDKFIAFRDRILAYISLYDEQQTNGSNYQIFAKFVVEKLPYSIQAQFVCTVYDLLFRPESNLKLINLSHLYSLVLNSLVELVDISKEQDTESNLKYIFLRDQATRNYRKEQTTAHELSVIDWIELQVLSHFYPHMNLEHPGVLAELVQMQLDDYLLQYTGNQCDSNDKNRSQKDKQTTATLTTPYGTSIQKLFTAGTPHNLPILDKELHYPDLTKNLEKANWYQLWFIQTHYISNNIQQFNQAVLPLWLVMNLHKIDVTLIEKALANNPELATSVTEHLTLQQQQEHDLLFAYNTFQNIHNSSCGYWNNVIEDVELSDIYTQQEITRINAIKQFLSHVMKQKTSLSRKPIVLAHTDDKVPSNINTSLVTDTNKDEIQAETSKIVTKDLSLQDININASSLVNYTDKTSSIIPKIIGFYEPIQTKHIQKMLDQIDNISQELQHKQLNPLVNSLTDLTPEQALAFHLQDHYTLTKLSDTKPVVLNNTSDINSSTNTIATNVTSNANDLAKIKSSLETLTEDSNSQVSLERDSNIIKHEPEIDLTAYTTGTNTTNVAQTIQQLDKIIQANYQHENYTTAQNPNMTTISMTLDDTTTNYIATKTVSGKSQVSTNLNSHKCHDNNESPSSQILDSISPNNNTQDYTNIDSQALQDHNHKTANSIAFNKLAAEQLDISHRYQPATNISAQENYSTIMAIYQDAEPFHIDNLDTLQQQLDEQEQLLTPERAGQLQASILIRQKCKYASVALTNHTLPPNLVKDNTYNLTQVQSLDSHATNLQTGVHKKRTALQHQVTQVLQQLETIDEASFDSRQHEQALTKALRKGYIPLDSENEHEYAIYYLQQVKNDLSLIIAQATVIKAKLSHLDFKLAFEQLRLEEATCFKQLVQAITKQDSTLYHNTRSQLITVLRSKDYINTKIKQAGQVLTHCQNYANTCKAQHTKYQGFKTVAQQEYFEQLASQVSNQFKQLLKHFTLDDLEKLEHTTPKDQYQEYLDILNAKIDIEPATQALTNPAQLAILPEQIAVNEATKDNKASPVALANTKHLTQAQQVLSTQPSVVTDSNSELVTTPTAQAQQTSMISNTTESSTLQNTSTQKTCSNTNDSLVASVLHDKHDNNTTSTLKTTHTNASQVEVSEHKAMQQRREIDAMILKCKSTLEHSQILITQYQASIARLQLISQAVATTQLYFATHELTMLAQLVANYGQQIHNQIELYNTSIAHQLVIQQVTSAKLVLAQPKLSRAAILLALSQEQAKDTLANAERIQQLQDALDQTTVEIATCEKAVASQVAMKHQESKRLDTIRQQIKISKQQLDLLVDTILITFKDRGVKISKADLELEAICCLPNIEKYTNSENTQQATTFLTTHKEALIHNKFINFLINIAPCLIPETTVTLYQAKKEAVQRRITNEAKLATYPEFEQLFNKKENTPIDVANNKDITISGQQFQLPNDVTISDPTTIVSPSEVGTNNIVTNQNTRDITHNAPEIVTTTTAVTDTLATTSTFDVSSNMTTETPTTQTTSIEETQSQYTKHTENLTSTVIDQASTTIPTTNNTSSLQSIAITLEDTTVYIATANDPEYVDDIKQLEPFPRINLNKDKVLSKNKIKQLQRKLTQTIIDTLKPQLVELLLPTPRAQAIIQFVTKFEEQVIRHKENKKQKQLHKQLKKQSPYNTTHNVEQDSNISTLVDTSVATSKTTNSSETASIISSEPTATTTSSTNTAVAPVKKLTKAELLANLDLEEAKAKAKVAKQQARKARKAQQKQQESATTVITTPVESSQVTAIAQDQNISDYTTINSNSQNRQIDNNPHNFNWNGNNLNIHDLPTNNNTPSTDEQIARTKPVSSHDRAKRIEQMFELDHDIDRPSRFYNSKNHNTIQTNTPISNNKSYNDSTLVTSSNTANKDNNTNNSKVPTNTTKVTANTDTSSATKVKRFSKNKNQVQAHTAKKVAYTSNNATKDTSKPKYKRKTKVAENNKITTNNPVAHNTKTTKVAKTAKSGKTTYKGHTKTSKTPISNKVSESHGKTARYKQRQNKQASKPTYTKHQDVTTNTATSVAPNTTRKHAENVKKLGESVFTGAKNTFKKIFSFGKK